MREIQLTKGLVAVVDDEDFERVARFKWTATKNRRTWYAVRRVQRNLKQETIYLHRFIVGAPANVLVDHRDRNGLNCQQYNLRLATYGQNACNKSVGKNNTSGHKGVSWNKHAGKWIANIAIGGKQTYLGLFEEISDAAKAYREAALEMHAEFSSLD